MEIKNKDLFNNSKNLAAELSNRLSTVPKAGGLEVKADIQNLTSSDSRSYQRENSDPALKTFETNGELNQTEVVTKPITSSTTEQLTQPHLY